MVLAMPSMAAGGACTRMALRRRSATMLIFLVSVAVGVAADVEDAVRGIVVACPVLAQVLQLLGHVLRVGIFQLRRSS